MPGPLQGTASQQLSSLAASGRLVHADIGRVLIQPNKIPDAVFILLEGRVRILGVGPESSHPELIQTLRPGEIAGMASHFAGSPVEAATVSEKALCLMVETPRFSEFLDQLPDLKSSLEHRVTAPELYSLLASDLSRNAIDIDKAARIVRSKLSEARLLNGTGAAELNEDYLWWIAAGPSRGLRWSPEDGLVRRIGLPARFLAENKISATLKSPTQRYLICHLRKPCSIQSLIIHP